MSCPMVSGFRRRFVLVGNCAAAGGVPAADGCGVGVFPAVAVAGQCRLVVVHTLAVVDAPLPVMR